MDCLAEDGVLEWRWDKKWRTMEDALRESTMVTAKGECSADDFASLSSAMSASMVSAGKGRCSSLTSTMLHSRKPTLVRSLTKPKNQLVSMQPLSNKDGRRQSKRF